MSDILDILDSTSGGDTNSNSDFVHFINTGNSSENSGNSNDDLFNSTCDENENEPPLQRLQRLQSYSNHNDKKNAVKYIIDALRMVQNEDNLYTILQCTKKLADDIVTQVQIDALEKFVPVVEFLAQNFINPELLVRDYLFQSIIQTLGHANNRVRKASQAALIRTFELEQVNKDEIENDVIPTLVNLNHACDEYKNEAVMLMSRLAPYVGSDLTLKYFVPAVVQLCSTIAFQTRKTCTTAIGDFATIIPPSAVDEHLVNLYLFNKSTEQLCSDSFWGVRKGCAEVLHPLATVCSLESRWNVLSTCLIQLLQDQSRWVKTAALRVLGYFISTFHDPNRIGQCTRSTTTKLERKQRDDLCEDLKDINTSDTYNDFQYWRIVPKISLDGTQQSSEGTADYSNSEIDYSTNFPRKRSLLEVSKSFDQDDINSILPSALIDFYTSIIEQSYSSGVETDVVHQSAHTFPAVALTITNSNWHLIRDTHRKLSEDLQWKVRRTLAYSLHELAKILTTQQTEEDLCPVFESFLRDVDEVKIGIITHLAEFFKLLRPVMRNQYLEKLTCLTSVDNQRNWRFRSESAIQLQELCALYNPSAISDYILPLAFSLSLDKVHDVRRESIKALAACYDRFSQTKSQQLCEIFIEDSHRIFARSMEWRFRQAYVHLCQEIVERRCETPQQFALRFFDSLLRLKHDHVVNVRLTFAQFLQSYLTNNSDYYSYLPDHWRSQVSEAIQLLQNDRERDVRICVGGVYEQLPPPDLIQQTTLSTIVTSVEDQVKVEQENDKTELKLPTSRNNNPNRIEIL
ncbi:unnamed protein product [Didymodactylos carnosus]|uniref:Protein phosphatase 4 regulatory subunit 1 n=1 Tax=Didymodactylos carnosus TaxID=1234261 RepID=A0A813R911_9BILA|nr:unnamed protein product [Didymodactylos carnosus]CAF0807378.1 unnamed protein product [Didymodactylos carnosus]CAF3562181.1 unnamed protein product [Didymodactylos carnosus]CAF3591085.1 unnamed protein product [Didymodactylos carnosus]